MSMRCTTHGKTRTLANLDEVAPGEYRCKSINPCKVSTGTTPVAPGVRTSKELAAAGHAIIHPEASEVCHAHGKRRGPSQLYQVATLSGPQWECLPEARCKVTGERRPDAAGQGMLLQQLSMGNQFNPYGGGSLGLSNDALLGLIGGGRPTGFNLPGAGRQAGGAGAAGVQQQTCAVHQKRRSMASLTMGADGRLTCTEQDRCKVKVVDPTTLGTCSLHGKQRRLEYLTPSANGAMVCSETFRCQ